MNPLHIRFEPALWLGTISAGLSLLVAFGIGSLTDDQATLIVAAISAVFGVVTAVLTRPVAPAAFSTLVVAGFDLVAGFGLDVSQQAVGAVNLFVLAVLALLTRNQVSPAAAPAPRL